MSIENEHDKKIVLNVGGIRYQTTLATIRSLPDTLLGRMFSESNAALQKREKDGSFFFDRNGRLFEAILDAYRCGGQVLLSSVSKSDRESFERELEFWGLANSVAVAESESDEEPALFRSKQNRFNLQVDNYHADAFVALLQAIHNTFSEIEIRFDFNPDAESLVSFAAWSKSSDGSRTKTFFTCSVADYVFSNASVFPANEMTIVMHCDRLDLRSCATHRSYDFSISSVDDSNDIMLKSSNGTDFRQCTLGRRHRLAKQRHQLRYFEHQSHFHDICSSTLLSCLPQTGGCEMYAFYDSALNVKGDGMARFPLVGSLFTANYCKVSFNVDNLSDILSAFQLYIEKCNISLSVKNGVEVTFGYPGRHGTNMCEIRLVMFEKYDQNHFI